MPNDEYEPTAAALDAMEIPLPEWNRLAVRDYWTAVIADELEAVEPVAVSYRWPAMGPGDRRRAHRARRRAGTTVLRSIPGNGEAAQLPDVFGVAA